MVVIPSDEHETLKSTVESLKAKNEKPDVDYLHAKAAENSMVVIPSDEHEKLKSISADHDDIKSKNENPDIEYLKSKATIHSMVLLPVEEHDALKEKSQKYSTLSAAYENPELEYLNQKAEANSMILVTPEEYEKIKSLPELEAAYGELKAKYESPDLSYIKSYASTHDLIAIPIQIFNGMKDTIDENSKEIETLRNHAEHPEVDYLKQNANKHSMVVIPSKDHEDLKRRFESPDVEYLKEKATSHSMVVVSSEEHENLQKQILTPQQEYIVKKANEMNLHVISEEEYEEMVQKSETPSVDVCKKVLAANNMIVLSQVEYQTNSAKLTEYKTKLDSNHAKSLSITDEDVKTYKSTSDDVEVDSRIKALEETILNPGKQYIVEKAEMYDLIAIPKDEYKLSLAREPINKETITANASNFGLVAISSKEYSELVKSSEAVPSVAIAERILVSNGYVCLTEKEYKDILSKSNSGIGSAGVVGSIAGAGSAAGALIGNAIGNAIGNGGSLPSTQSFASAPTVSKSAGITSGAQTLPGAVYLSGLHKEENNVERRPVESFEQIPSSEDDDIYEDAEDDIDDDQDANSLFSITRLREEAGRLGFTLVKFDEFSDDDASIVDNTTTRVHDVSATEYNNSNILSINSDDHQVDKEPLKEDVDLPRLRALAATLGVTINESGGDSGSLKENGNRELSKEVAGNGNTGTIENMTKEELSEVASRFGFIVISKVEYERLRSPKITSEDLVAKASELHLTLLSDDEFEALKTQQDIPIEILEDQASKKGYLFISNDKFIATTVSRTADVNNVVVLPATYYNKLFKSHEWYKYNKDQLNQPPPAELKQPQQPLPQTPQQQLGSPLNGSPLSSGNDLESKSFISGAQVAGYQGTDNVVDSDPVRLTPDNFSISALSQAPSLHTIMTNMTFTSSEIIAVITQTIIGEYLFKYYRRLGPLSALSDTRHERYFWIHPYSLTLYWSNNNPVLSETSENKIRAMAIVSVESVEDNNPLPPGLYYKSIIIHSHDRSVKITCPSRQRHNIWYNAIRYLLQRSTADFLNDDEIENQYNENFEMDQKINVERSQSFRHSQPRQSILSSKRSFSTPLRRSNTGRTLSTRPPTLN
ncbi:unnamed protein product [[Candida] boidinii]|uniref:Unnamed protein product n=1 Tax=Candida boidinii TaxID=5477 RepID=A0A9W6SW99_CANBO|nr:unnamed protein product [[Candida] boidinii]